MQVETYETISLDVQGKQVINEVVSEEALALIESLGLDGQRSLVGVQETDDETTEQRIPYRLATREEQRIFAVLFPTETPLSLYRDGAIPLRALQVAAHAQSLDLDLYVWHPTSMMTDDPVLIGKRKDPKQSWVTQVFLLARWGVALDSLDALREQAVPKLAAKWLAQAERTASEYSTFKDRIGSAVAAYLHGEEPSLPNHAAIAEPAFVRGR